MDSLNFKPLDKRERKEILEYIRSRIDKADPEKLRRAMLSMGWVEGVDELIEPLVILVTEGRPEVALAATQGKMTLMGNLNNPELLLSGSPDQVADACRKVIRSGVHILSPECAVPLKTPLPNLQVLVDIAKEKAIL